jgi:hypothetical protein
VSQKPDASLSDLVVKESAIPTKKVTPNVTRRRHVANPVWPINAQTARCFANQTSELKRPLMSESCDARKFRRTIKRARQSSARFYFISVMTALPDLPTRTSLWMRLPLLNLTSANLYSFRMLLPSSVIDFNGVSSS